MGDATGHPPGPGPVFLYEWILSSRRWQGYALRSLFVAALLAALAVVWSGQARGGIVPTLRGLASVGEIFYRAVVGTQLVLVLLAAPAATAGSICLDRARGTLTHLLVTDLSAGEIVLGKLAARLVPVVSLVLCTYPIMGLLSLLGGVDPDELLGALLVTLGMAVLGSSLALAFSLWAGKTHEALLGTYAVLGVWVLGPWMISSAGESLGVSLWIPPRASDPFRLAFANSFAPGSVGWADDLAFLGATWTISAGLAALAVMRLRAVCARERVGRRSRVRIRGSRPPWLPGSGKLASLLPGPSLDANPVLWREWHRNRPSPWARSVVALFVALSAAFSVVAAISGSSITRALVNAFQVSIGLLLLSVTAATSLAEERARGSLDVLMATPLSTRQIVLGKWLGAFRMVPPLAILPTSVALTEAGRDARSWPVAFVMAGYVVAAGAAIAGLGVAMATWCPRLGRAVGLTVAAYVVLTVGWMFLIVSLTSPHPYGIPLISASPFYGPILITDLAERMTARRGDLAAVVLWIVAYAAASFALLAAALKTFDRCLGRVGTAPRRIANETGDRRRGPLGGSPR